VTGGLFSSLFASVHAAFFLSLSLFRLHSGSQDDQVKFFTAVYNTLRTPTNFTEAGNLYLAFDQQVRFLELLSRRSPCFVMCVCWLLPSSQVHVAEGYNYRTDMSIWDIMRSQFPLYAFLRPDDARNIMLSMLDMGHKTVCFRPLFFVSSLALLSTFNSHFSFAFSLSGWTGCSSQMGDG
jgi:hypothetical protein